MSTPAAPGKITSLVGAKNFKRNNPNSDLFDIQKFEHIEFLCQDATNTGRRFGFGLGLKCVAKSDMSTNNHSYASYVYQSGETKFIFTAPYGTQVEKPEHSTPHPNFDAQEAHAFNAKHGLAARAIAVRVGDAHKAWDVSTKNGAVPVTKPQEVVDKETGKKSVIAEVVLYGDVRFRMISGDYEGPSGLPNYEPVDGPEMSIGIKRIDHCVGNVPKLLDQVNYMMAFTGFHEFAEFTAEDVGTVDSGLNSMVLANNLENVLLPINEPTFGTRRKSQIQTYLEQNVGAGLQHIALKTDNIFHTLAEMRKRSFIGGFEFMPRPSDAYYKKMPERIGSDLSEEQYRKIEELGLLVDKDDQGILIQIFTKPLGDRPTIFIEIIERVGCMMERNGVTEQSPGCGGFGKGNFSELFKSIEEYEKTLDV